MAHKKGKWIVGKCCICDKKEVRLFAYDENTGKNVCLKCARQTWYHYETEKILINEMRQDYE